MFEVINSVDGKEIPQMIIIDECIKKKLVKKLKLEENKNLRIIHIGNGSGCEQGMSDEEIVELGRTLGKPCILTYDKGFLEYKNAGYHRVVLLKQLDSKYGHIRRIMGAGIKVNEFALPKMKYSV